MAEPAKKSPRVATTTAGLRGVAWKPDRLPSDVAISVHPLATEDGAPVADLRLPDEARARQPTRGGRRHDVVAHARSPLHWLAVETAPGWPLAAKSAYADSGPQHFGHKY